MVVVSYFATRGDFFFRKPYKNDAARDVVSYFATRGDFCCTEVVADSFEVLSWLLTPTITPIVGN